MKKLLLFLMFVGTVLSTFADTVLPKPTSDYISVNDVTVVPGSNDEYELIISLEGSQIYTAYEMDIKFPPGLDIVSDDEDYYVDLCNDDGIYPTNRSGVMRHTIAKSYGKIGESILRLVCYTAEGDKNGKIYELSKTRGKILSITCKAGPYLKPGTAELKVSNLHLITKENGAQQYNCADQTLTVNVENTSTAGISVSPTNKWGTCVLPFTVSPLPSGLKAYSVTERSEDEHYAILKEESELRGYVPYILYAENGFSAEGLTGTVDANKYAEVVNEGILYGAVAPQKVDDGFVLQNQGEGVKLYSMYGTEFNIPAGKCWVKPAINTGAKVMELTFADTDGITAPTLSTDGSLHNTDGEVYSLGGHKVAHPVPGNIYIINGQKVLWMK